MVEMSMATLCDLARAFCPMPVEMRAVKAAPRAAAEARAAGGAARAAHVADTKAMVEPPTKSPR